MTAAARPTVLSGPQWPSPLTSERARIAQLLRRATPGVTPAALKAAFAEGYDRTVDRLLETPAAEPPDLIAPDDDTRGAQLSADDLQRWWVRHLLTTPAPFAERLTLFWHGHFTSEIDKVGGLFAYWQNLTWRRIGLGRLVDVLHHVTVDPAMLVYLDLDGSDASDAAQPPNENYARELMELFTMGPGHYAEADVKAGARALAGWNTPPPDRKIEVAGDQGGEPSTVWIWDQPAVGVYNSDQAYAGEVRFLGRSGRLGLDEVIGRILEQPATAAFLARKVASAFVTSSPGPDTVDRLAGAFQTSGHELRALMRAALTAPELDAAASYRSLVKSPIEFMVGAALAVGAGVDDAVELIVGAAEGAGQVLFQPPNVAGWPGNGRWISPATLLARCNFATALLDRVPGLPPAREAVDLHLDGVLSPATAHELARAASERQRWLAILVSPEFNLK